MVMLGLILLILGLVFGISLLTVIGLVLLVIGAVLWFSPAAFQGGRRWY